MKEGTIAVIAAYNEEKNIGAVIRQTKKYAEHVLVINDGSTDRTAAVAAGLCNVISAPRNMGKGHAIARGIREALAREARTIILLDADGEHDPRDIPRLVRATQNADLAVGRRARYRSTKRRALNTLGDYWLSYLIPKDIDVHSGFRAMRAGLARKLTLRSKGFEIEVEMLLEAALQNARIASVPITTMPSHESGVTVKDYLRINNFFDSWVLSRRKSLNIPAGKKALLITACAIGLGIGTIAEKILR